MEHQSVVGGGGAVSLLFAFFLGANRVLIMSRVFMPFYWA